MSIMTLDDLKKASPQEIEATIHQLSVVEDLRRYVEWLVTEGPAIQITAKFERRNRTKSIHPSTISHIGFCPLRAYYECTGKLVAAPIIDFEQIMTFDIGTLVHELIQEHFTIMFADQFRSEAEAVYTPLYIRGSADGLFTFSFARAILEIKTIKEGGSYGFARVQDKPLPDHPRQVMCYQKAHDAPFGIILYICKNNGQLKEHIFSFDENVWNEVEAETLPIVKAVYENGPMVQPKAGSNCYLCPFSIRCAHSSRRTSREGKNAGSIKSIRL